ncbi:MAG: hypothetical protein JXR73_01155 [Candidatus Omnitrophica bacterium]|nr:hypothetical protein [Candidatus Omnitrophota bacterium]
MQSLFIFPFLIAPFFIPQLSAGLRMTAILAAGAMAVVQFIPSLHQNSETKERLSPFLIIFLIAVFLLFFSISDPWHRYVSWPSASAGVLLLLAASRCSLSAMNGLIAAAGCFWILAMAFTLENSALFPLHALPAIISAAYSPSTLIMDSNIILPEAIRIPPTYTDQLILQSAAALTTTLLAVLAFRKTQSSWRVLQWLPLIVWSLILFSLAGRDVFIALPLILFIFLIALRPLRSFASRKALAAFVIFCALIFAGFRGYLDFLTTLSPAINNALDVILPFATSLKMIGVIPPDALYFNQTAMGSDRVITAALGLGMLLLILETGFKRRKDDLRFPAGVSLLILTVLSLGPSLHGWLIHPLTWIALACLQNANRKEAGDQADARPSIIRKEWAPWAIAGFAGFLTLFTLSNLYPHWRTEAAIQRFAQSLQKGDRSDDLTRAFRSTPYRGDVAALYSTESIMTFYPQGVLPPSPEPEKLESFLNLGAKHGFVSLLGYARLSGLFFLHSQGERSLAALRDAVLYAPDEPALREMLADALDTLGQKEEALQQYRICANLNPALPRIREKMARIYLALGRQEEALRERNNLLTLDPSRHPRPN